MSFSEIPPPPVQNPGNDLPELRVRPPGPQSRTWLTRLGRAAAPMGARSQREIVGIKADVPPGAVVFNSGFGSNVMDVDGNRYVDLAQGFGAQLVGHRHKNIARVLELQAARLWQALGDVYPSDAKIGFSERLVELYPGPARVILGQSGADAVTAALKTAALATGRPGVIAFRGSYHGLSYGPLSVSGLRDSYRQPFADQLNAHVQFAPYASNAAEAELALARVQQLLELGNVGAILVEPILGRGGVLVPHQDFLPNLRVLATAHGALLVVDEIWTGLGRSGAWLESLAAGATPDLICLGKGLGGGLPISACLGDASIMGVWSQEQEVVHTSTFAGAPLSCATGLALLDLLRRQRLPARAAELGERWIRELGLTIGNHPSVAAIRGRGLMIGIELTSRVLGGAVTVQRSLLERGYITSTGGGAREVLVLTPPLNIDETLLEAFSSALSVTLRAL